MDIASRPFRELYEHHWPALQPYLQGRTDLSPPLLVCPPESYAAQVTKLVVVGQETKSWYNDKLCGALGTAAIARLLEVYQQFGLGLRKPRSIFWMFVRELERGLGIAPGAVVWTNVNKVDQNGRRPKKEVRREIRRRFPVLRAEITLAQPDVVVFLTGRAYDWYVQQVFPGCCFREVEGFDRELLATIEHPELPCRTLRTNHPRRLRVQGEWDRVLSRLTLAHSEGASDR